MPDPLIRDLLRRTLPLWLVALVALPVRAQQEPANTPGEILLGAFSLREEGMKAEKERDYQAAYKQYRASAALYDRLAREFPDWKPGIVEMRRKNLAEQITGVADKAAQMDAGKPVPRNPTPANPAPMPAGPVAAVPMPRGMGVGIRPPAEVPVDDPLANKRIEFLERQQETMRSMMAELTKQRDDLKTQLKETEQARVLANYDLKQARAEKDRVQTDLTALQEKGINAGAADKAEIRKLQKSLNEAEKKLADAESRATRSEGEVASTRKENDTLKTQLSEAQAKLSGGTEGELREKLAKVEADLSQKGNELETLTSEKQSLADELTKTRKERDDLQLLLANRGGAPEGDLVAANKRLMLELNQAREELAKLAGDRNRDALQMEKLRQRVGDLETELAAAHKENSDYRDQMARLQDRLSQTQKSLAEKERTLSDPVLIEENRTLKEIVIKQLRGHAYRSVARSAILAELAKLEVNSKVMLQYIDQLEGKDAVPTPEQVARIHDPEIEALSGVGLNAIMFTGNPPPNATPGTPPDAPDGPDPSNKSGSIPPQLAGDPDARADFEFQKKSMEQKAGAYFATGDFVKAADTYRQIVEVDPADVPARCNLGVSQLRQHKFEDARATFQRALESDESSAFAHLMLGVCHWQMKKPELAIDRFNRSLVLQPRNAQAWTYLGLVALERSAFGDAETALKKALEIKPDDPETRYNLAVVYTKPGHADPVEARKQYDEAVRLGAARDTAIEDFLRLGQPEPAPLPQPVSNDPAGLPVLDDKPPGDTEMPETLPELGQVPR